MGPVGAVFSSRLVGGLLRLCGLLARVFGGPSPALSEEYAGPCWRTATTIFRDMTLS